MGCYGSPGIGLHFFYFPYKALDRRNIYPLVRSQCYIRRSWAFQDVT